MWGGWTKIAAMLFWTLDLDLQEQGSGRSWIPIWMGDPGTRVLRIASSVLTTRIILSEQEHRDWNVDLNCTCTVQPLRFSTVLYILMLIDDNLAVMWKWREFRRPSPSGFCWIASLRLFSLRLAFFASLSLHCMTANEGQKPYSALVSLICCPSSHG